MTDKQLKHLSRRELLQLLLEISRENDLLRQQLEEAQAMLADRRIRLEHCDSMAQATMELNGAYKALEAACAQYLDNLRMQREERYETWETAAD